MKRKLIFGGFILIDTIIIVLSGFIALYLRFEGVIEKWYIDTWLRFMPVVIPLFLLIFYLFGLYRRLWEYASISELLVIPTSITISSICTSLYMYITETSFPRSIYIMSWGIIIAFVGASRLLVRILYHRYKKLDSQEKTKVLIVGAGDAGAMIAREIQQRYSDSKKLIGFIDADPNKWNQILFGVKVLGDLKSIQHNVNKLGVQEIIIAIPSASGKLLREIVQECKKTNCSVKTVPSIYDLIDGKVSVQQLREVHLEDLLRREPVKLDLAQIANYLSNKRVLVTGAGGSIGSELCRQIAVLSPELLILLGKGENSIYEIDLELREKFPQLSIIPIVADIRDFERVHKVFIQYRPEVVFHAAAHKHVPLMEAQPVEAVRNNIFGTKILTEISAKTGVGTFVFISTDKAVNPTSVMGATKRVAELIIQNMNENSKTKFVAVRFGNVLGSRGSVIPLFKKQIMRGGPVTVTHPEVKRYFMTIPEAVQLVLQAGSMASGGEVFVLDMGEPVKIIDMARDLIELSGFEPNGEIKIEFTGMRPGEKLFEELLTAKEDVGATKHEKIFIADLKQFNDDELQKYLLDLQSTLDDQEIKHILSKIVPTYQWASKEKNSIQEVAVGKTID